MQTITRPVPQNLRDQRRNEDKRALRLDRLGNPQADQGLPCATSAYQLSAVVLGAGVLRRVSLGLNGPDFPVEILRDQIDPLVASPSVRPLVP